MIAYRSCYPAKLFYFVFMLMIFTANAQELLPRKAYATTLITLTDALLQRQVVADTSANVGGIWCAHCHVWHTRAAEAVYPFTIVAAITGNHQYSLAAQLASEWLFRQQQPDGSWKETPEEWTGTTTDQLLMLLLSYEKISTQLTVQQRNKWLTVMKKAADYLDKVMSPEFASINYVATTTAALAKAGLLLKEPRYTLKAGQLARRTVAKMDEDGFLNGEGGRSHGNKMGADLGYNMEMSLWGLGLYARLTGDTLVDNCVKRALKNHLYFIYPDGSLDASWGIRSNKWTGYGSATSDGCAALFSLYADEDPRYVTAALRNVVLINSNITNGLLGYGPHHAVLFETPPCIYPTFAKAKNLALAYALETKDVRPFAALPADETSWIKSFPSLDVIVVRTRQFMATITGYRYKDQAAGVKGKYMFRPDGGTISHLWAAEHGFMTASSPTVYTRPEPMSFPEAPGVLTLTPRIEYTDTSGYFTNLFEFDSRLAVTDTTNNQYTVSVYGELKDKYWLTGGVGYHIDYLFADSFLQKSISIIYHDAWPVVRIIEPVVRYPGMTFEKKDEHTILISAGEKKWMLTLLSGNAQWKMGIGEEHYWAPYPALKAYPLEIEIHPDSEKIISNVTYRLSLLNKQMLKIND